VHFKSGNGLFWGHGRLLHSARGIGLEIQCPRRPFPISKQCCHLYSREPSRRHRCCIARSPLTISQDPGVEDPATASSSSYLNNKAPSRFLAEHVFTRLGRLQFRRGMTHRRTRRLGSWDVAVSAPPVAFAKHCLSRSEHCENAKGTRDGCGIFYELRKEATKGKDRCNVSSRRQFRRLFILFSFCAIMRNVTRLHVALAQCATQYQARSLRRAIQREVDALHSRQHYSKQAEMPYCYLEPLATFTPPSFSSPPQIPLVPCIET
jgi:hypothetical protein